MNIKNYIYRWLHIHKNFVVFIAALLFALFLSLYIGRAWIRTDGVRSYANLFHKPTVDKIFDADLGYVNQKLAELGVDVNQPYYANGCSNPQYENVHISVSCSKSASSGKVYDTEQFTDDWRQNALFFEDDLLARGWIQINDTGQNIVDLLNVSKHQPEIVYLLDRGKVSCSVRIGFNKYDTANRRLFVDESCYKEIKFFGGY